MNCFAYPVIFDAMKSKVDNYLSIEYYDSGFIHIYRKGGKIYVKDGDCLNSYTPSTFNFYTPKPINKITIIWDKYGQPFSTIFDKDYFRASVLIQRAWKNYKY
jgi:hypothetical protein